MLKQISENVFNELNTHVSLQAKHLRIKLSNPKTIKVTNTKSDIIPFLLILVYELLGQHKYAKVVKQQEQKKLQLGKH